MTHIPLFHGDLCTSIFAVMLFPDDLIKACVWAARTLSQGPLQAYLNDGQTMPTGHFDALLTNAAADLSLATEIKQSQREGEVVGKIVKVLWSNICTNRHCASWSRAIKRTVALFKYGAAPLGQSTAKKYLARKKRVLHLWGAWHLRGAGFNKDPDAGSVRVDDLIVFLNQSDFLLDELIEWTKERDQTSSGHLDADHYRSNPAWTFFDPPRHAKLNLPV